MGRRKAFESTPEKKGGKTIPFPLGRIHSREKGGNPIQKTSGGKKGGKREEWGEEVETIISSNLNCLARGMVMGIIH